MALSGFIRRILGSRSFPLTRGQDLPDPVGGKELPPRKEPKPDSRFVKQGWDKLNPVKSPPRQKPDLNQPDQLPREKP